VMVVISGFIPVITMLLALKITKHKPAVVLAGIISVFSVFYQPYISNTDSFTLYMVLGGLFLLAMLKVLKEDSRWYHYLLTGLLTGFLHFCRADGLLVFLFVLVVVIIRTFFKNRPGSFHREIVWNVLLLFLGYLSVMAVWYIRNLVEFHSLMPPGNSLLLWSTKYNDIFKAYTEQLTFERFIAQGLIQILTARLSALWVNVKSILAVNGSLFLGPLIIIGMWTHRDNILTKLTTGLIALNLITMSFLFPYAGFRGGFFHSNTLTQSALWAFAPIGLIVALEFAGRVRKWNFQQSWRIFSSASVVGIFILSTFMVFQRIVPGGATETTWNGRLAGFTQVNQLIIDKTHDKNSAIMVNDPPGYHLASGRSTLVVPTDSMDAVFQMAKKFNVRFLILNQDNITINNDLEHNDYSADKLRKIIDSGENIVYEFIQE
jgi:hypothetical protein